MARAIGNDEIAGRAGEVTIGDIDRDALFALGAEAIDKQGEIRFPASSPDDSAILVERRQLVVGHFAQIMEQASDQRRFAVVDATAGDEAKERARHQKYPSRFLRSIDPAEIMIDRAALPLGGSARPHFGDDRIEVGRFALDCTAEWIAAKRTEPDHALGGLFTVAELEAFVVDHQEEAVALDDGA